MTTFTGFTFNSDWQFIANDFDLSESNIMSKIDESIDLILPLITDTSVSPKIQERIDDFILFIGFAASTGHPIAVALSCFIDVADTGELTSNPFAENLPVPINQMDDDAKEFMIDLYEKLIGRDKSPTGMKYLENNYAIILEMAKFGDSQMQFLLGLKGSADGFSRSLYRKWYEQAALGGFELAYYHAAAAFDGNLDDLDRDWGKTAYWNYQGAKVENRNGLRCCYNLGIMYAMGDFVEKNTKTASFYLSLAYRNAHRTEFPELKNDAINAMKEHSIEIQQPPYLLGDREMDPELAELSNIYK